MTINKKSSSSSSSSGLINHLTNKSNSESTTTDNNDDTVDPTSLKMVNFSKKGQYQKIPDDVNKNVNQDIVENEKLPTAFKFIIGNEICERFAFYGIKTVLVLYLKDFMGYSPNTAVSILHSFNFIAYLLPMLGAYMADARIGKFKTILYFSLIYLVGTIFLSVSSVDGVTGSGGPGHRSPWALAIGLSLICLGTGGIKPVVTTFVGDQLTESQTGLLLRVFQIFYFCINLGSVSSTIITPLLRRYVGYWLAFSIPSGLLAIAIIFFVIGRPLYRVKAVSDSIIWIFAQIVGLGIAESIRSKFRSNYSNVAYDNEDPKTRHWVDRSKIKFDKKLVDASKAALNVFLVFVPMPFFWAMYDQSSSRWTLMSSNMNLTLFGSFTIQPEQIQTLNPLTVMIFIPVIEFCIYRPLRKLNINFKPLYRMCVGMWLAVITFILSMFVQLKIDNSPPNSVPVYWLIPQYLVLTFAEIFISVTGLEFAYSQAPSNMKSIIMSGWYLSISMGNLFVVFVVDGISLPKQWIEYLFFAGVMSFFNFIFMIIAYRFQPINPELLKDDKLIITTEQPEEKSSLLNSSSNNNNNINDNDNDQTTPGGNDSLYQAIDDDSSSTSSSS
eukprot:gene8258-10148_t